MRPETKIRLVVALIFITAFLAASFVEPGPWNAVADRLTSAASSTPMFSNWQLKHFPAPVFRLGLDLQGGTHLVYEADLKTIPRTDWPNAMNGVRDVIERRVNAFGVAEPVIQVNQVGDHWRLIVELAGVLDVNTAIKLIGETPYLDFRELDPKATSTPELIATGLDGRMLKRAQVSFDSTNRAQVSLQFTKEGADLFQQITKRNVQKIVAIFLDGEPISTPVVQQEIVGGEAVITGNFTPDEAQQLVTRLNAGALPVPIALVRQQTVGPSLGRESLEASLKAGAVGFMAVALFMLVYYRALGLLAIVALLVYSVIVLAIFKSIPVTLTLSGIAGFILSLGMAVDANILIFERVKEEILSNKDLQLSVDEGFQRAWTSIRDSNLSSMISAAILYSIGVSVVQGFALTLGIGVLMSMFTAVFFTRRLVMLLVGTWVARFPHLLVPVFRRLNQA